LTSINSESSDEENRAWAEKYFDSIGEGMGKFAGSLSSVDHQMALNIRALVLTCSRNYSGGFPTEGHHHLTFRRAQEIVKNSLDIPEKKEQ